MATLDLVVMGVLGLMAAWPFLAGWASSAISLVKPRPASPAANTADGSPIEEWRQAWAFTLIRLIDDIEAGETHFEDDNLARKLARDLLWEVIGGDGPSPSKAK